MNPARSKYTDVKTHSSLSLFSCLSLSLSLSLSYTELHTNTSSLSSLAALTYGRIHHETLSDQWAKCILYPLSSQRQPISQRVELGSVILHLIYFILSFTSYWLNVVILFLHILILLLLHVTLHIHHLLHVYRCRFFSHPTESLSHILCAL